MSKGLSLKRRGAAASSLSSLYDRYCDRAYRMARAVCSDEKQAEDVVHDGFLAVRDALERGHGEHRALMVWLLAVIRDGASTVDCLGLREAQLGPIVLAVYGELSDAQIVEELGLPPTAHERRVRRGSQGLRAPSAA